MANMLGLSSCAISELGGIRYGAPVTRKDAYSGKEYVDNYGGRGEPEFQVRQALRYPPGTAIVFSDPQPYAYGPQLAAFIRKHKLGKLRMVEGVNKRYTDGHKVKIWLWLFDHTAAQAFAKARVEAKAWPADWKTRQD